MKSIFAGTILQAAFGALALSMQQEQGRKTNEVTTRTFDEYDDLDQMLKDQEYNVISYLAFEYAGPGVGEMFSTFDDDEMKEVKDDLELLILERWLFKVAPELDIDDVFNQIEEEMNTEEQKKGLNLAQADAEFCGCAIRPCGFIRPWLRPMGYGGLGFGGCGGYGGLYGGYGGYGGIYGGYDGLGAYGGYGGYGGYGNYDMGYAGYDSYNHGTGINENLTTGVTEQDYLGYGYD